MFLIYLFVFVVFALPSETEANTTLVLHHFVPDTHSPHKNMLVPWAKAVEQLSEGKVKIIIAPGMELGGRPKDLIKQASEGKVDLVWTVNGYSGTTFIRSEVFELPFVHVNNPVATNLAMLEMFESDLKKDYKGLKIMFLHSSQGHAFQSKGYPIRKPSDLRGKRARTPSRTGAWTLETLKAQPMSVPVRMIPQTLQRRSVSTIMLPFTANPLLKLQQHITHMTEGSDGTRFGTAIFQVSMGQKKWNALPPEIQEAFTKASGEWIWRKAGQVWHEDEKRGLALMTKFKRTHVQLTEKEIEAFEEALQPVTDRWIKEVEAEGINGKKLVEKAKRLVEKYSSER